MGGGCVCWGGFGGRMWVVCDWGGMGGAAAQTDRGGRARWSGVVGRALVGGRGGGGCGGGVLVE